MYKEFLWLKLVRQSLEVNDPYPVCVRVCFARLLLTIILLPQSPQVNGRSPVYVRVCVVRLRFSVNFLPRLQCEYEYVLSDYPSE